ncbi:MAG: YidC/Oxa1 family membrane protein insertase [Lachnospirales bacterium]
MLNFLIVARDILDEPWILTDCIAKILGFVINIFFYLIYDVIGIEYCSLGLSIILLTVFARLLLFPIAYKQQASMFKMQALQPELKKIQDKYKDNKNDPEIQRKIQMETQKLYSENNVNPLSGCLPLIIQLPIFFGLYYVMQNPFLYISNIGDIYDKMSNIILTAADANSGLAGIIMGFGETLKVPNGTEYTTDILSRMINCLGPDEMSQIKSFITDSDFTQLFALKTNIESFLGLNLTETIGYELTPKLIIPLLSGLTTYLSSWLMNRRNKDKDIDPTMKMQQKIMNITMPLMMAWVTISLPAGIGVYWITSNVFMLIQQVLLGRHFEKKGLGDNIVIPKEKNPKKKKKNKNHEQYPRTYR